jgi:hypothetical protein
MSQGEGACGPKFSFLFFTRLEAGFLHFGVATLCLISQPNVNGDPMGMF